MIHFLKRTLSWTIIVSLLLLGFPVTPSPQAASLTNASVTISDSAPAATGVTYNFAFTTGASATSVTFTFDSNFTSRSGALPTAGADYTCPAGLSLTATTSNSFTCAGGTLNPGNATSVVTNITNPTKSAAVGTADTYKVTITTNGGEDGEVMFAIIEAVVVTATVEATLQFTISGVNSATSAKNTLTTATTTPTTIPFGTLVPNATTVAAQDLRVTTNASDGFFVRVYQDGLLRSAAGDTISTFKDNTPVPISATEAWSAPSGILDTTSTYGHFGFSSEDKGVKSDGTCGDPSTTGAFGDHDSNLWAGFNGTNREPVMCHTGPADGQTQDKGYTRVVYRVEISSLQPAGEYTNTLTYIATPTY